MESCLYLFSRVVKPSASTITIFAFAPLGGATRPPHGQFGALLGGGYEWHSVQSELDLSGAAQVLRGRGQQQAGCLARVHENDPRNGKGYVPTLHTQICLELVPQKWIKYEYKFIIEVSLLKIIFYVFECIAFLRLSRSSCLCFKLTRCVLWRVSRLFLVFLPPSSPLRLHSSIGLERSQRR